MEDRMLTSAVRVTVSAAACTVALAAVLATDACSRSPSPETGISTAGTSDTRLTIGFENEAETYVDVYLVGERREWRLGRVAPGARTSFGIPAKELAETPGFVQLAVLEESHYSVQVVRDPRATLTIAQPVSDLVAQRWTYWPRPLSRPQLMGMRK